MVKAAIHLVPLGNESLPQIARFICPKSSIITGGRGNITQESRLPVKKKMLIDKACVPDQCLLIELFSISYIS